MARRLQARLLETPRLRRGKIVAPLAEAGAARRGPHKGIPLTERTTQYSAVLPDRITIYRRAICDFCHTDAEVVEKVRRTVIHEVGHHFGIDDPCLRELGW